VGCGIPTSSTDDGDVRHALEAFAMLSRCYFANPSPELFEACKASAMVLASVREAG